MRKEFFGWNHLNVHARVLNWRNPVRHAGHGNRLTGGDRLPNSNRTDGLNVHVVLRQADAREQSEECIKRSVLERHDADGFAFEVSRFCDAGILAYHKLHETFSAEHGDYLDRYAVLSND